MVRAGLSARFSRSRERRHVAGELVHGARRGADRRVGGAAGAGRKERRAPLGRLSIARVSVAV
jgi:hypothetical protein